MAVSQVAGPRFRDCGPFMGRASALLSPPAALFANGEQGAWYEPSPDTCFQDDAGTTPADEGDPIGYLTDLSGNGHHLTQAAASARPTYKVSGTRHYLDLDGVDDNMALDFGAAFSGTVVQATTNGVMRYQISAPTGAWKLTQNPNYILDGGEIIGLVVVEGVMSDADYRRVKQYFEAIGAGRDFSGVTSMQYWLGFRSDITSVDVRDWDVSAVENMLFLFRDMSNLTIPPDVSHWDTAALRDARYVFYGMKTATPPDVSGWDMSGVYNLRGMFQDMSSLITPPDVSGWDLSAANDMRNLFQGMSSLITPPDVSGWDVSSATLLNGFATDTPWDTPAYDALLIAWGAQTVRSGVRFDIPLAKYTAGGAAEAGRSALISQGWVIYDGGPA